MLALCGFLTIALLLALILSGRVTPLVALVTVPVLAALVVGQAAALGGFVTSGIQQTAPVAATFVFAIIYFGVMSDAGLLDPAVDGVLRVVGSDPVRIVVGSAVLGVLAHLDGSGASTFLLVIPAMLPLYQRLDMDRRVLACVVALAAGVMNMLPWGGPLLRAAAALHVSVSDLFLPLIPVAATGVAFVFTAAWWLGRREAGRLGHRGGLRGPGRSGAYAEPGAGGTATPPAAVVQRRTHGRGAGRNGVGDRAAGARLHGRYGGGSRVQLSRRGRPAGARGRARQGRADDGHHPAGRRGVHRRHEGHGHARRHGGCGRRRGASGFGRAHPGHAGSSVDAAEPAL